MKNFLEYMSFDLSCGGITKYCYGAFAVICVVVLYLLLKPRRVYISKNIDGTVALTKSAIKKIIETASRELGICGKIRTKICCCRGKCAVDVVVQVGNWQNLSQVTSALQDHIRNLFLRDLGLTNSIKINIIVSGFLFKKNFSQINVTKSETECDCNTRCDACGATDTDVCECQDDDNNL